MSCTTGSILLGGIFDYDLKSEQLTEVMRELESPEIWSKPEQAQALGRERALLEKSFLRFATWVIILMMLKN